MNDLQVLLWWGLFIAAAWMFARFVDRRLPDEVRCVSAIASAIACGKMGIMILDTLGI